MSSYHRQCAQYLQVSLAMLAIGLILPLAMAFVVPSVSVSPAIWNFLQIGGLTGAIVFWIMGTMGRSKAAAEQPASEPAV